MNLRPHQELFVALCRARLRVVAVSCMILAGSAIAFGLMYVRLKSVIGERVNEALLSVPVSPSAALPLVERLAHDVHGLVMGQLWTLSVIGLSFGAILFLGSEIPLLLTSFVVEAVLLPSDEWTREYRRNRDAYERTALKPLVVICGALFLGVGWWAYENVAEGVSDERAWRLFQNLVLVLAATVFGLDYVLQVRLGFLRYLAAQAPGLGKLFRVLCARFAGTAVLCAFLWIGLEAVERYMIPRIVWEIEASESALVSRGRDFAREAKEFGVAGEVIDKIQEGLDGIGSKTTAFYRGLPAQMAVGMESIKPTLGLVVFFAFLTTVYFPLVYMEVRWALVAVTIVVGSLILVDEIVRWVMPRAFKLVGHGPSAIVATGGLVVVLGETIAYFVIQVFHKHARCWKCGKANSLGGRFCSGCGAPFGRAEEAAPAYLGVGSTLRVHRSNCGHLAEVEVRGLVGFESAEEAVARNYKPCRHCLKKIETSGVPAD